MAQTGGTAAPNVRINAAARVLGAPKVTAQRQQRSTPSARPPRPVGRTGGTPAPPMGRGLTQHQVAPQRPVVQHQAARQPHESARPARAPRQAPPRQAPAPRQTAFNPLEGDLNSKQLAALATSVTKANDEPLIQAQQTQAKEIVGAEGTALQRQAAMGATGQGVMSGLQAGEEASAKTAQNNAAEAAVKAGHEIETSGQSASTATAGFVDPAVKAALAQSASTAGALGGAAGQYAAAMGVSGQNQMSQLRAAAAQRITEGGQRISQDYGQAQQKAQDEEDKLLAKQPAEAKTLAVELGQKQLTDAATLKSLGVKEGTLGVDQEKAATEKAYKEGQTSIGKQKNTITAEGNKEKNSVAREKNAVTLKGDEIKARNTLEKEGIKNAGELAKEKVKAQYELEIANKKAGRLTTNEEDKMIGELGNAFNEVKNGRSGSAKETNQEIREALTTGKRGKEKVPTVKNQTLITAALEAWDYHKVSSVTLSQLRNLGIQSTPKVENGTLVFS
jgi:hypothetical protein